jgi:hypothetical protein
MPPMPPIPPPPANPPAEANADDGIETSAKMSAACAIRLKIGDS